MNKKCQLVIIKILLLTYTITAISWMPPLISQPFHPGYVEHGHTSAWMILNFLVGNLTIAKLL